MGNMIRYLCVGGSDLIEWGKKLGIGEEGIIIGIK